MQSENSQKVIARFFQCLDYLKALRIIKGKYPFARAHGVDYRNFYKLEVDHSRDLFQVEWLTTLVDTYKVNPMWLLCGQEPFFQPLWNDKLVRQTLQNPCNGKDKTLQNADN